MITIIRTLLFLFLTQVMDCQMSSVTAQEYDCNGSTSGVCESPSTCSQEFSALCPVDGTCCPEVIKSVREEPVSGCNNRKCFRTYNGWWSASCISPSRTMFFCDSGNISCCASACRILPECSALGGKCISKKYICDGVVFGSLCKGYSCFCCVPAGMNTTSTSTSKSTSGFSMTTASTSSLGTTSSVMKNTTTASKVSSTTSTSPSPSVSTTTAAPCIGASNTNLSVCPATGQAGVACTCPRDCSGYGANSSGIELICPISNCPPVKVKCMAGWTLFIYRNKLLSPPCNFSKTWGEYKAGFCEASGEYWLGLEYIHAVTMNASYSMSMHGLLPNGTTRNLVYGHFAVEDENTKYRLMVGGFNSSSSTGVDLFVNPPTTNTVLNGSSFSTFDRDNDNFALGSCSVNQNGGGWWFNDCTAIKATQPNIDWYFWNYPAYEQGRLQEFYIKIKRNP